MLFFNVVLCCAYCVFCELCCAMLCCVNKKFQNE